MNTDEIQILFFQECEEGLAGMEQAFATIRDESHDPETINTIFRCVHSIKGGAGAFGHERLQAYTHEYETLLDLVRNETLTLDQPLLDTILAAFDMLADHVAAARDTEEAPADVDMLERLKQAAVVDQNAADAAEPADVAVPEAQAAAAGDDGFDDLMAMLGGPAEAPEPVAETAPADWNLRVRPARNAFDNGSEPLLLLRELARLGATTQQVDLDDLPPLASLDAECSYLTWTISVPESVEEDDIRSVFEFTDGYTLELTRGADAPTAQEEDLPSAGSHPAAQESDDKPQPGASQPASSPETEIDSAPPAQTPPKSEPPKSAPAKPTKLVAANQTIRVDLDKLDKLVNLVGELVITQAMLAQQLSDHDLAGIPELGDLDLLTRDLQESTMAIRAQPMNTVFSRVPRIIRELEGETGKRVRLEVEGEMTEVDKTVVERIGEPLTHLIRNAVDHGLESTERRVAAGKPEEGVVKLSAAHHSGRIVITVSDDGGGINRKRVRERAVERGIIQPDAAMSDEEIDNLIFAPGFSTAEQVSSVSGRGVGMDVVRRNIQALGGRIGIQSREGIGSSFSLSLPLTLAVLDGMIVTVGKQTYVIPLSHIVESLRPNEHNVSELGDGAAMLDVRGSYVPLHRIASQLNIDNAETNPREAVLIVVDGDHGLAALMVDSIEDQRQVVVKSLEANYRAINGLAGATILGDGQVALILDVDMLTARRFAGAAPAQTLEMAA